MSERPQRSVVRWAVPVGLVASCLGAATVSWHASSVPSVALGSHLVLALQLALIFFYGSLLLLVPLVRAIFDGDLPIELSLRGARWEESLRGFEVELLSRQADVVDAELRGEHDLKREMDEMKEEMREAREAQEAILDWAVAHIALIEEKVMSPEPRD